MDLNNDIFLSLIETNKGIIYKIAHSYCKSAEDRKDLIQEIIIHLWRSFSKYDDRYRLSTWIYTIALNVAISYYRKNKVRNENTTALPDIIYKLPVSDDNPTDANLKLLREFIQELGELDKALMILYLEGKSQKEISQVLGISATNVSTKINRIKNNLKQKFSSLKSGL